MRTQLTCVLCSLAILIALGMGVSEASELHSWDQKLTTKRFDVLLRFDDEAVLDHETQLVWEQAPSTTTVLWSAARISCANKVVSGRMGWRLPTFYELASLVDADEPSPSLPPNHPFDDVAGVAYWASTTHVLNDDFAWHVNFGIPDLSVSSKVALLRVWCVRGGSVATDAY